MVASGWSEAQKRAYVLAENELALKAGWDDDLLKAELADLTRHGRVGLVGGPKASLCAGGKRAGAESRLGRRFAQGRARRSHPSWSRRAGRRPKSEPMCWRKTSWR